MIQSLLGKFDFNLLSQLRRGKVRGKADKQTIAKSIAHMAPEILENRCLLSSTWFVSPSGSNDNAGNMASPFKTIQAAANVAQAGDHVEIRAGLYNETVTPARGGASGNPIVYEAYNGESVTISGASPLSNWTLDSGNIYEAAIPTNLGEGNNQLFVDGQVINEARFPNSTNLSRPTLAYATSVTRSGKSATIYDSALSQPAGYWTGAIIHIAPGQAWTAQTGTVTSSAPGQVTFSYQQSDSYELPTSGNGFYLTGSLNALKGAGEFYVSSSGKAYLSTPAGDNPDNHDVEAKQRAYAFNLNSVSNITIQNINIVASTITTSSKSAADVLNHLTVTYPSQFLIASDGWVAPSNSGIMLNGSNDLLENSVISNSPGDGVYVTGAGSRVTNNVIHDVDTSATDAAAVRVVASNVQVDHNTIYNTGRDGIKHSGQKLQILSNTLYNIGLQTTEAGAIYCVETDGGGTVIAYNTISNMHSGGYGQTALFLDNYSSNYTVHNNIVSNVDVALKLNFISRGNNVYNNTLSGSQESLFSNYKGDWKGTKLTNNIFYDSARIGSGATSSGNVTASGIAGTGAGSFTSGASSNAGSGTSSGGVAPPTGATPPVSTPPTTPVIPTTPTTPSTDTTPPPVTTTPPDATTPPDTTTPPDATTPPATSADPSTPVVVNPSVPASSPITTPTVADLQDDVATDRTSLATAISQRQATLSQLRMTIHVDEAAYVTAHMEIMASHRAAVRAERGATAGQTQSNLAAMQSQLGLLQDQVKADRLLLQQNWKADFTGIAAARKTLADAIRTVRASRRGVK